MKIGPKYKIARRLNASVFEKTQTQKFVLSQSKKSKKQGRGPRQRSAYGEQMMEKQKARFTYLLTEKKFSSYVEKATASKSNTIPKLYSMLESRLDNTVYRAGLSSTRSGARQMVSHGHITVNGKKVTIPSYAVSVGEVLKIRQGSVAKPLFSGISEKLKAVTPPAWLKVDPEKVEIVVSGEPVMESKTDMLFDLNAVIEFYSR